MWLAFSALITFRLDYQNVWLHGTEKPALQSQCSCSSWSPNCSPGVELKSMPWMAQNLSEEHFICFGCSYRGEMSWGTDCLLLQRKGHRQKGISHEAWNWFHRAATRSSHACRGYWSGSSRGNLTDLVRKRGKGEFFLLIFLIGWMSEAFTYASGVFCLFESV